MRWQVRLASFCPLCRARRLDGEGNSPDAANNAKLLRLLGGLRWKSAPPISLRSGIGEVTPHGATFAPHLFEGIAKAVSATAQRSGRIWHDPLFCSADMISLRQLGEAVKNRSAPGQAWRSEGVAGEGGFETTIGEPRTVAAH